MKKYLKLISRPTRWKCFGITLMALVGSILMSLGPVQLGKITTAIAVRELPSLGQLASAAALYGLISLVAEYISTARRVLLDCTIASHEKEIRANCIEKMLRMPISYYCDEPGQEGKLSGERTAQLNQGIAGLSQLMKICCNDIVATILTAACTLVQAAANAPLALAAIMLIYLVITTTISSYQIRSQNGVRENIIAQKNALDGQVCQSIINLELIRSMNAGEYEKERLNPAISQISATEKHHHRYMGLFDALKQLCKVTFQVILLLVSGAMVLAGWMSPSSAVTVCLLFQQLVKPIDEVYRFMDETASSALKAKAILEITSKCQDPVFSLISRKTSPMDNEICIKNAVILDPSGRHTLAEYDELHIPSSSIVALVGDSGCGKTTLARCLNRYYPSTAESITLWGRKQADYSQQELTSQLLYLPQKTYFFAGTVRDNLCYGLCREVSDEELTDALRSACLYDSLAVRTQRVLDYQIGEGGTGLSGGEGQRLSLARIFLHTAKTFILDESTTGLDDTTVKGTLDNLEAYAVRIGAGIIYISHDERVIKRCHQIIQLHNKVNHSSEANIA